MSQTLKTALEWREARANRLAKQKEVDELEKNEKKLKQQVIDALKKTKNKAVSDGVRLFQYEEKDAPVVTDWTAFYEHVKSTGEFELLYRRMNEASVKERWENKVEVPGVGKIPVPTLSDTKA